MKESEVSRRRALAALFAAPPALTAAFSAAGCGKEEADNSAQTSSSDAAGGNEPVKAFCIDFNWATIWPATQSFAKPGLWGDADPKQHVDWYQSAGCNTIQTFCVSCNGYAWYKSGKIPEQTGMKHDFLPDVCRMGHERGLRVMGYFCGAANTRWQKLHPEQSYAPDTVWPNIVFTKDYLEYMELAITEALTLTDIDGFMIDWMWTPHGEHLEEESSMKWLPCEQQMYQELFGKPFPGKDRVTAEDELEFKRRSIDRLWTCIHSTAKRVKPDCIIWLSCSTPNHPTVAGSKMVRQVDWLMNESPNDERWEGMGAIGDHTKLLQCVVGWGERHNARSILGDPKRKVKHFYGFAKPYENSLPLPVDEYLRKTIDSFEGNDKNIATLSRFFNGLPFDYLKS